MRVAFLSVSASLGGAERVLLDAVAVLRERCPDWQCLVVSLADGPLVPELESSGVEVRIVPLPPRFAALGESGRTATATLGAAASGVFGITSYVWTLRTELARWRPDVVHANGLKADVLAAWAAPRGSRVVWHLHDYIGARRVSSALLRHHSRRAAVAIANSASVANDARGAFGTRIRVAVLHNGIDTRRFTPHGPLLDLDDAAGLTAAPSGTVRLGLVATYAHWKGHEVFLRALAQLAGVPFRAYVVGGPVYQTSASQRSREELERMCWGLGLAGRVGFIGFQRDVAPIYRALDVVVHASTQPEPFGLVVAEAMACGRTVVASDAGGIREIVERERTGLLHRPGDVKGLVSQLRRVALDAALRTRLGAEAAWAVRARFARERFGARLVELYASLEPFAASARGVAARTALDPFA